VEKPFESNDKLNILQAIQSLGMSNQGDNHANAQHQNALLLQQLSQKIGGAKDNSRPLTPSM
jgi:hypothetical protein